MRTDYLFLPSPRPDWPATPLDELTNAKPARKTLSFRDVVENPEPGSASTLLDVSYGHDFHVPPCFPFPFAV